MKNIKRFIFPLTLVLLLAACSRTDSVSSESKAESKSSETPTSSVVSSSSEAQASTSSSVVSSSVSSVVSSETTSENQPAFDTSEPEDSDFTLINPTDTSMLSKNCKAYVDAMREQEEELMEADDPMDPYKYHDLKGTNGVNISEDKYVTNEADRVYLDKGDPNGYNQTRSQTPDRSDKNMGVDLKFESDLDLQASEYKVLVSLDKDDFSKAKECEVKQDGEGFLANAKNLFVNTKYYWKVVADDEESHVASFETGDYPRWIDARPMYNVRDLGGYMTESGHRVKQGLVFRGGEIATRAWASGHTVTSAESSKKAFREDMGMAGGVELELRGSGDIGDGYNSCVFAENNDIQYVQYAIKSYEQTFTNTRNLVPGIFEQLKNADQKHVYFHCWGGADRTATVAFLLNGLLGVSYTDLVIDFELTSYSSINNEHVRCHIPGFQHSYDRWPALINQLKTDTTGGYAWDDDALLMDNIENFLVKACSVPQATINTIRDIMLED